VKVELISSRGFHISLRKELDDGAYSGACVT